MVIIDALRSLARSAPNIDQSARPIDALSALALQATLNRLHRTQLHLDGVLGFITRGALLSAKQQLGLPIDFVFDSTTAEKLIDRTGLTLDDTVPPPPLEPPDAA
jgi:hypothetical protein